MISDSFYEKIVKLMPIPTVEAVILNRNDKVLVLRRKNFPAKNEWWFPGGRIRKGETLEEALLREVKQETGLNVEIIKLIGIYSRIFLERHDISITYLCRCNSENVVLDNEHLGYMFLTIEEALSNLHPFLQKVLRDAFL